MAVPFSLTEHLKKFQAEVNYLITLAQREPFDVHRIDMQWSNVIYWQELCRRTLTQVLKES